MSVFLCRAAGVEGVVNEKQGRLLFTLGGPEMGAQNLLS